MAYIYNMGKIVKALGALGNTSAEVHETLLKTGSKGYRAKRVGCPVATYLNNALAPNEAVRPLYVDEHTITCLYNSYYVTLTYPVREFVRNFDDGDYVDLDLEYESPKEPICPTTPTPLISSDSTVPSQQP